MPFPRTLGDALSTLLYGWLIEIVLFVVRLPCCALWLKGARWMVSDPFPLPPLDYIGRCHILERVIGSKVAQLVKPATFQ